MAKAEVKENTFYRIKRVEYGYELQSLEVREDDKSVKIHNVGDVLANVLPKLMKRVKFEAINEKKA